MDGREIDATGQRIENLRQTVQGLFYRLPERAFGLMKARSTCAVQAKKALSGREDD